ncbi:fkbp-type peptidyl-prolyl cis-trans isomerase [Stylonychia lemnae]|uniref:peptidylprolyl isomerase n=1 Tax=Stylonychia lemnae TaxID=5949 RepID=A0A078B524_STYLE|nr:fkbp-type peptidyl-prolyl cis-trans isomerase [Stylonychia lemnae]|eukprot:CDW89625.1 fkbp-type peptidyl-prolyl cis-trans isomerase [Stylonychia lemnae]
MNVEFLDQGVGDGKTPQKGQTVWVHYTGKLTNGKVFDASIERGEPIKFILGVGQVIPCWDRGIAQLQLQQKARLTCPPDLAYGSRGAGSSIPPNSTLIFDVELHRFQ